MRPGIAYSGPAVLLGLLLPVAAHAQAVTKPGLAVEAATDDRRRGLSWSDGRPTLSVTGYLPLDGGFEVSAGAAALRGSARHGGADAGIHLGGRYRRELGAWQLSGGVTGHVFAGAVAGGLNYAEGDLRLGYLIGPLSVALGASYAPRQRAIGGDNLHLRADADIALPGTPWRLRGGLGRSSGTVRDLVRAARLRPGGTYWDYSLAAEYSRGPATLGARLTATSIDDTPVAPQFDDRDRGTRLAAFARLDF